MNNTVSSVRKSICVEYQRIVALDRENGSEIRVFVNVTFMVSIRTPCECITATVSERKLCWKLYENHDET